MALTIHIGESGQAARGGTCDGDGDAGVGVSEDVGCRALSIPVEHPATLTMMAAAPAAAIMVSRLPDVPTAAHDVRDGGG